MGDSTTCLMQQPFCYASGISNEANENNPIHALGQSISFGRFISESLAWEKWSSFSHNRYVEEAERYSRPGSVAQKKAFFEAHYKKLAAQKAAALLEQANNASQSNGTGGEDGGVIDNDNTNTQSSQPSPKSEMAVKEEHDDAKVLNLTSEPDNMIRLTATDHDDSHSKIEASVIHEYNKLEGPEPVVEQEEVSVEGNSMKIELQNQLENVDTQILQVELQNQLENVDAQIVQVEFQNQLENVDAQNELSGTPQILTPILKGCISDQEILTSMGKKKPPVSSMKLMKANGTTKFTSTPVKSTALISSKRDNIATPLSNKPGTPSNAAKRRSTPKSLQMSVTFTPIRELNRLTASVMRKFENTRVGAGSSKASKDNLTPLKTPTTASKEMQKHSSLTPLTEKKRNKTPLDLSSSGNHTAGPKWRLLSGENRMRSPIISSPFSLRTEERAARRKKKLEEKFNANEVQKVQLHTKLKEKAETEIRKLRQSFCFKARPLPDFYKDRKVSKNETRKDPLTHSESSKDERISCILTMPESKTFHPNRPLLKNSGPLMTHPLTSNSMMITTHENTSPNIQHAYQNYRSYK